MDRIAGRLLPNRAGLARPARECMPSLIYRYLTSRAVGTEVSMLVGMLQGTLGQALLAVIMSTQPRTLARWASGESWPSAAKEQLLRHGSNGVVRPS